MFFWRGGRRAPPPPLDPGARHDFRSRNPAPSKGGRLGDKFGQRKLFLIGTAGFTAASAVCGLAPGPALLGAATVGGPILAGFLIDADLAGLSWRLVFLINLVLGVFGTFAAARLLPRATGDRSLSVDGVGAGLLGLTMFALMYGLIEGSNHGWGATALGSLTAGLLFLVLYARPQSTAAEPLIKPTLLRNKGFTSGLFVGMLYFSVTSGLLYVTSLFMQQALHSTPGDTALGLLPLTLGIIASAVAGMAGLTRKLRRTLILAGMLLTLAGAGWLLALVLTRGTDLTLWAMAPAVFVTGLGMGACFGTIFDITLGDVSAEAAGPAGHGA